MKDETDYLKFVRWSEADHAFIGYCPDLFTGGVCHGKDKAAVDARLCRLVREEMAERQQAHQPLPKAKALVAMAVAA